MTGRNKKGISEIPLSGFPVKAYQNDANFKGIIPETRTEGRVSQTFFCRRLS